MSVRSQCSRHVTTLCILEPLEESKVTLSWHWQFPVFPLASLAKSLSLRKQPLVAQATLFYLFYISWTAVLICLPSPLGSLGFFVPFLFFSQSSKPRSLIWDLASILMPMFELSVSLQMLLQMYPINTAILVFIFIQFMLFMLCGFSFNPWIIQNCIIYLPNILGFPKNLYSSSNLTLISCLENV